MNVIRRFMIRTECSSRWLSDRMGITQRHLVRVKNDRRYPPGRKTLCCFNAFLEKQGDDPIPSRDDLKKARASRLSEAMKKLWADPKWSEFLRAMLKSRKQRRISRVTARRSWQPGGGLRVRHERLYGKDV